MPMTPPKWVEVQSDPETRRTHTTTTTLMRALRNGKELRFD